MWGHIATHQKPNGVGVAQRLAGTLRSRLMRIKDPVDPSEQSSIIYRAQCKDSSSNYIGQASKTFTKRLKEHRSAIRNFNMKTSLMASHCVDTGHNFELAEAKIHVRANRWTARIFKEAWLTNIYSVNACKDLPSYRIGKA